MTLDAHQHFWQYNPEDYGWIDESMREIRKTFLPCDLEAVAVHSGVTGSIAVQARQSIDETNWLIELAENSRFIKGVVGWAPLAQHGSEICQLLDTWAVHSKLRGFRHVLQLEENEYLDDAAFNAALKQLPSRNLSYDLLIFSRQLPAAIRWTDRHPDLKIILDHIAKPTVSRTPPQDWCESIYELAKRQNVYCKFSGLVTEAPGWKWDRDLLRPYFEVVLNAFGPNRLMFGSDWPVCLVATSYSAWHDFVTACIADLSGSEREAIMGRTCAAAYSLNL